MFLLGLFGVYWVSSRKKAMPEVVARFEFKPERAHEFSPEGSLVVEQRYDAVEELIADCEEFQKAIVDVTAIVNGRVVNLSAQPSN